MSLLITEADLATRLETAEVVYHRLGQGSDNSPRPRSELFKSGIPDFARKIIAGEARSEVTTNTSIAKSWGISRTAVDYAEQGRIGRHQKQGEEIDLVSVADEIAEDIATKTIKRASERLYTAIDSIKDDAVKDEKPMAQTIIARNLASVIEKLSPKAVNQTNIQFNVFTPTTKRLEDFGEPIRIIEKRA